MRKGFLQGHLGKSATPLPKMKGMTYIKWIMQKIKNGQLYPKKNFVTFLHISKFFRTFALEHRKGHGF